VAVNDTSYAVALSHAALPTVARYVPFYLYVVFALCEGKSHMYTDGKVPLRMTTCGHRASRVNELCLKHREPNHSATALLEA